MNTNKHTQKIIQEGDPNIFYSFLIYTKVSVQKINVKINKKGEQLQMM
jgi:hypothetical protein